MTMGTFETEVQVFTALQKRYPPAAWALFPQVRNGTGFSRRVDRTADAIALGLWPSRGLELIGFEIKVRRGDWLHELRQPAKADEIAQYCDCWYLVIGDVTVATVDEVPQNWGLLVPHGTAGLKVAKQPQGDRTAAKALDRLFVASLLKNAAKARGVLDERRKRAERSGAADQERYSAGLVDGQDESKRFIARLERELEAERRGRRTFEEASGVSRENYSQGEIGAAVKIVLAGRGPQYTRQLRYMRDQAQVVVSALDKALQAGEN